MLTASRITRPAGDLDRSTGFYRDLLGLLVAAVDLCRTEGATRMLVGT